MHTRVHAKQPLVPIHRYTRVHTQRTPRDRDPDTRTRKNTNQSSRLWPRTSSSTRGSGRSRQPARSPRPGGAASGSSLSVCLSILAFSGRPGGLRGAQKLRRNAPLVRSLLRSLPQRSAPSPPAPHTPSPPLPRPGGSLGGGGCEPGRAAAEGRASRERNPLAPRAQLPRSPRVRSQGGALGGGVRLTSPRRLPPHVGQAPT